MTRIDVNVRQVEALADRLQRVTGERLGRVAVRVVNESTEDIYERAVKGETAGINLTQAYVRGKTDVALAVQGARPTATITTRGDLTVLGNFAPVATVRAPGAPRRAGPIRGRRNAGVVLSIRKSGAIKEDQWFSMPLRRGDIPGGNGLGVFVKDDSIAPRNDRGPGLGDTGRRRDGKAGKRHIYGPSPYQLFRKQIAVQGAQWADLLEERATSAYLNDINEVLL